MQRRPITDHRSDLPADLIAIIDRAMSRSRSARYQTGEEMARDLRGFLDDYVPGYRRAHFAQFMRANVPPMIDRDQFQNGPAQISVTVPPHGIMLLEIQNSAK